MVPAILVVGGIAAFTVFFLDGMVERAVEKYGSEAVGARVDLAGADISFFKTSVTLRGLQVTLGSGHGWRRNFC